MVDTTCCKPISVARRAAIRERERERDDKRAIVLGGKILDSVGDGMTDGSYEFYCFVDFGILNLEKYFTTML